MLPIIVDLLPWLLAMTVLIACSGFFSAGEAALFSLRALDQTAMAAGGRGERAAARLLNDPERVLSAVLFWNLVVNMAYFAIASIATIELQSQATYGKSIAATFAFASLLTIIFCSEMLPKSIAVLRARWLAGLMGIPLAMSVRIVDPIMPVLRFVNTISRRLISPSFKEEPYMEISDLERAIELSTSDAQLVEQERAMLRNIVMMSDIRVDEWMRPRSQFVSFRPPVSLSDLGGQMTPSGYLLVTEPDSEEVAGAVHLQNLSELPAERLDHYAEPVVYVPWCAKVADAVEQMLTRDRDVAAIVNEFGETIGILTFEDILDTIFTYNPSRSKRLLDRNPIHFVAPGIWLVAGVTSLRRLERHMERELPPSRSVTVAGVVQEALGRLAIAGDQCDFGPLRFRVLEVLERGNMLVELRLAEREEDTE